MINNFLNFYTNSPDIPLWLSIFGGMLFIAFGALSVWGYMRSMNKRQPKHITEAFPFFKRAFAEGKPVLWFSFIAICFLTSITFFTSI